MTFYGYILVSSRRFYGNLRGERGAHSGALFFVGMSQLLLLFAGLKVLDKTVGIELQEWMQNRYAFVTLFIGWFIALSMYYSLSRAAAIEENFETKTERQQSTWGWIALASFLLPVAILYFLF